MMAEVQKKSVRHNSLLSREIRAERRRLFPKFEPTSAQRIGGMLSRLFNSTEFLGIAIWVSIVCTHFLLMKYYPSIKIPDEYSEQNFTSLIDILISVMAALLGIGIPILILVVDNISSKKANYLLPLFFRASGVIQTAGLGLSILALLIILKFFTGLSIYYDRSTYFWIGFTFALATIIVLIDLIRVIRRMNNLFSDAYMEEKLSITLADEIRNYLSYEIDYRLAESAYESIYSKFGFHHYLGIGFVRELQPVYWSKSGRITDIDLNHLEKILKDARIQTLDNYPRGYYTKNAFDIVTKNELAFYVRCSNKDIKKISKSLLAVFKISHRVYPVADISAIRELLKARTIDAIGDGAEREYELALSRYCEILRISDELPALDSDMPNSVWGKWRITFLAIMDLQTIAEICLQSPHQTYIRRLAWSLTNVMSSTLLDGRQEHIGEIPAILGLFPGIYHFCFKSDKLEMASVAYQPLLDTFLDPHEFWLINQGKPTMEKYQRRKDVYFKTIWTVAIILRNAIDNNDKDSVMKIFHKLALGELGMNGFHNSRWARDEWIISPLLETASEAETKELIDEIEIRNSINNFPNEVNEYIGLIRFAAASYVFEGVFMGIIPSEAGFALIRPIWQSVENFEHLTQVFLYEYEHYAMSRWSMFDRTPDTKQAYSPNFEQKFFYYYILKGIDLLARSDLPNPQQGMIKFQELPARTTETAGLILDQWDTKWEPIIGKPKKEAQKMAKILLKYLSNSI